MSIITNALSQIAQRLNFISQFSGSGLDSKRSTAWATYGYPDNIEIENYRKAYERSGVAFGAIHKLLAQCWQECPRIYEGAGLESDDSRDQTPWEKEVAALFTDPRLMVLQRLVDFDRRNLVGRYAALIFQVADGKNWNQPVERTSAVSNKRLTRLIPAFENQIRVVSWDTNQMLESFGWPTMYQFRTREDLQGDTQGQPEEWIDIHPDRIQIFAEGSSYGMFEGIPFLRAGFNDLINLEKIQGGCGEAFLKNASRQLSVEFDANADVPQAVKNGAAGDSNADGSVRDILKDQVKALNSNIDSALVTQGAKIQTLQSQMSDPDSPWQISANSFAASIQRSFTGLYGQMTGRLASDEDRKSDAKGAQSRQKFTLTPMIYEFITKMMYIGQISTVASFGVEWHDLLATSDKEKFENGKAMTVINKDMVSSGQPAVFDGNEVRVMCGYAKVDEFPVSEGGDGSQVP